MSVQTVIGEAKMATQADSSMTSGEFLTEAVLRRYSRREIVKRAMALGFSAPVISLILAACGGGNSDGEDLEGSADPTTTASQGETLAPIATTMEDGSGEPDTKTEEEDAAPTTGDSDSTEDNVEATGSIVISLAEEPQTMEHWASSNRWGFPILRNVLEALLNRDPETNELIPELAVSWERTDDLTWRFKLREHVTFHNGETFNAEVAAYILNDIWSQENAFSILATMGPQISAAAVDELMLDVSTESPDPILPARLYLSPISSMSQLMEDRESSKTNPVGTGPYSFVEWARGQHVRLTANPDWWGHGGVDPYGQVRIKDAEFQFRIESTVRGAQISAGEAHLTNQLAPEDCEAVPVCKTFPSLETLLIRLDTMHPVMADIRVRQAMAFAIDTQAICEEIYGNNAAPASQIYGPGALGYNDELKPYPYDTDRARDLIEEAKAGGVPTDSQLTITCVGVIPGDTETIQYVAEQLNQIGLNVQTLVVEAGQFSTEVYRTGQDQVSPDRGWLALTSHGNELMDASASLPRYYSCDILSDSTFCSEDIEPRLQRALELEGEERDAAFREVSDAYYNEYVLLPVGHLLLSFGMVEELNWTPRLDSFTLLKEMSFT